MSLLRSAKIIEMLLRKYPAIYKPAKRIGSLFINDPIYDYKGLIDAFGKDYRVLFFRNHGESHRDKKLYYITYGVFNGETCGFFGMFNTMLRQLYFADFYNLTPVVEWRKTIYSDNEFDNVFEYYFKPVSDISCKDIWNSANVCYAMFADTTLVERNIESNQLWSDECISELARMYREYIELNDVVATRTKNDIRELIRDNKILGVHARGTDAKIELYGHPNAIDVNEYISETKEAMLSNKYEKIFLATEDSYIFDAFLNEFGDRLIYFDDCIRSEKSAIDLSNENKDGHYQMGYEVLRDAYTLAECNGMIAGIYNVPIFARIVKEARQEKWDYLKIINKGISQKKTFYKAKLYNRK